VIVLGLNGGNDGTCDPAAALVIDGHVAAFIEEERLSRVRHARSAVPALAVDAVLREASISLDDVDAVAYGWDLPHFQRIRGGQWTITDQDCIRALTRKEPRRFPSLHWVRHHDAHAASVYFWSGLASAAVLVADGRGEESSITIYRARGPDLTVVRSWPFECSLGIFYEAVTEYCGFGRFDAGKTMGLAAYGSPTKPGAIRWDGGEILTSVKPRMRARDVRDQWFSYLEGRYGPKVNVPTCFDPVRSRSTRKDVSVAELKPHVAASAQATVENLMESLAQFALDATSERSLCISGGVGLNCVANGRLVDRGYRIHLQPTPHDAGVALGAAFLVAAQHGDQVIHDGRADLGPRYSSGQIGSYLAERGLSAKEVSDPACVALNRLLDGHIIGWLQGRMEVGPRALGNRSILGLPTPGEQRARVNAIKRREHWRPLAPSLLHEETTYVFGHEQPSPYMLLSFSLTGRARDEFPAITHVDGTARPQTIMSQEGAFSVLLQQLRKECGRGVILNTSFNGPGEPIVCTPEDAIRSFYTMPLSSLIMENFVLDKG